MASSDILTAVCFACVEYRGSPSVAKAPVGAIAILIDPVVVVLGSLRAAGEHDAVDLIGVIGQLAKVDYPGQGLDHVDLSPAGADDRAGPATAVGVAFPSSIAISLRHFRQMPPPE